MSNKGIAALVSVEEFMNAMDKFLLYVLTVNYEVMTAAQMKLFVTGCIEVANTSTNCVHISMILTWIEMLIENEDTYLEYWDGSHDDLAIIYDELKVRSHQK